MPHERLRKVIAERREELARLWLEAHLAATPVRSDDAVLRDAHGRSGALLEALAVALASDSPDDWGSFTHREAVQTLSLMGTALAGGGATATTAGWLAPALGDALERLGAAAPAALLGQMSAVATEAYATARIAALTRAQMDRLVRTTPVLRLGPAAVLVAACGAPDRDAAFAIVERALQAVLALETRSPTAVLDLGALEGEEPVALEALMTLPAELAGLGGRCGVVGLTAARRVMLVAAGLDLDRVRTWRSIEEALAACQPRSFLARFRRR
jgi:hypothetical protein